MARIRNKQPIACHCGDAYPPRRSDSLIEFRPGSACVSGVAVHIARGQQKRPPVRQAIAGDVASYCAVKIMPPRRRPYLARLIEA
jgi:hypothetical protein